MTARRGDQVERLPLVGIDLLVGIIKRDHSQDVVGAAMVRIANRAVGQQFGRDLAGRSAMALVELGKRRGHFLRETSFCGWPKY